MRKKAFKICLISLLCLILAPVVFLVVLYYQVSKETAGRIERGVIDRIIFSESPVYYDDGKTPIGVFFEKTHRKYIQFKDTPKTFIWAIVAAEDKDFFNHSGFDVKAITRAFLANLKARRIVQGGSTLTQQTAKNVFKRQKRTYMTKAKELMQSLLLERKYSKEEILEMYTNQFYVTGFGRGLRIAAQYFFDKKAEDLDLVESAFIAGSVKGPDRYNPFAKKSEAAKMEAMRRAKIRKNYVLENMFHLGYVSKEAYEEAKKREVPFKEGRVTFRLNVILDYIREQLVSDYLRNILYEEGVHNIATSGIKIYTSISKEIQEGALRSLRSHLSLLDVKLNGYQREALQERYRNLAGKTLKKSETDLPFLARVSQVNPQVGSPSIVLTWEGGGGIINYEGFEQVGAAWLKWKAGNQARFNRRHVGGFLKNFKAGDLVSIQSTGRGTKENQTTLSLTTHPELEGGLIVMHKGMVKAMAGGYTNRFFNRAVDAKRQLGSIFKPLVYAAALQLKWNTLDPLLNMKDIFPFEKTFYVPKPDHQPGSDSVSMIWAGVKSENLATVWLLYHLTDRLNRSEFRQVVKMLGLDRRSEESYGAYVERIRDRYGVVVNGDALMEAAFEESKKEIESDLIFKGHEKALLNLTRLHFKVDAENLNLQKQDELLIYRLSFQRLRALNFGMKRKFDRIKTLVDAQRGEKDPDLMIALSGALTGFYLSENENSVSKLIYTESPHQLETMEFRPIRTEWIFERMEKIAVAEIWIDDLIPSEVFDWIQAHLKENYGKLLNHKRYDFDVLSKVRDFRTLVNLRYVTDLAKKMGISSSLDPVLSFPLGANSISILDAALSYQTIMTGHSYPFSEIGKSAVAPVIKKIVDREGEVLWEYKPKPKRILTEKVSGLVSEILRSVIEHGTGRRAKGAINLSMKLGSEKIDVPIPSFGKTGTSNQFRNSSFVGYVPGPQENSTKLDLDNGYVIAGYVGYDDNRPMKSRHTTIYGASGALPFWIETANAITNSRDYREGLQIADVAFDFQSNPVRMHRSFTPVKISTKTGLPVWKKGEGKVEGVVEVLSSVYPDKDAGKLRRDFEPSVEE